MVKGMPRFGLGEEKAGARNVPPPETASRRAEPHATLGPGEAP